MAWLAIDAGTSVIKSVVFADDGSEVALARRPTTTIREQRGWSEQDMDEVWSAGVAAARESTASSGLEIEGIVITAQGDGCWLIDAQGRPTGKAILWNDARAAQLVEGWRATGLIEAAFRISGSVPYAGLMNAILAWLAQHAPERIEHARWALSCNGWFFAQLTGVVAADLSDASNPFSDVLAGGYSREVISMYGAGLHAYLLPPIATGTGTTRLLSEEGAAQLGLAAGLPVVMAPYDIACTAYGAGATQPGEACVILGTTICAEVLTTSLHLAGTPLGTTVALPGGLFLRAMPTLTGCEALQWAADMLALSGIPALDILASRAAPDSVRDSPFFLPYLSPAGERSPFLAPEARGSFHGLTLATTRAEIARSVYEGLCFVIRECLEAAAAHEPLPEVRVCGGGAASDFWCRTIADVLGIPVLRSRETENGARGAYLFALAATGKIQTMHEGIGRFTAKAQTFSPDPNAHASYRKRFTVFGELRDAAARGQWKQLTGLR